MAEQPQQHPFVFSGRGGEYFRIWIVNLCLSLVTLGIYSAWAKVRRLRYFHRHTSVAGASFDFHGDPLSILKGRILAFLMFGAYFLLSKVDPLASLAVLAVIMALMPWLLVRSYRFRMRNTSYRGLRFSFHGGTGEAYIYFLLLPIVSYVTIGLFWPFAHQQMVRYIRDHTAYGNGRFTFLGRARAFYKPYLILAAFAIVLLLLGVGAGIVLFKSLMPEGAGSTAAESASAVSAISALVVLGYLILFLFAYPFLTARLQNVIWNHTALGTLSFANRLRARDLFRIMLGNIVLIILTLGLFKPFADVRMARYRVESLSLLAGEDDLESFLAERQADVAATGEEIADLFDLDIAA